MDTIKINSGIVRLQIDRDGELSEISFNPEDTEFIERVYALMAELEQKEAEFKTREAELAKDESEDANGMLRNFPARLALMKEICQYIKDRIDLVFGLGTSQKAFGEANSFDMFEQFFDGITPYIKKARSKRLNEYREAPVRNVME